MTTIISIADAKQVLPSSPRHHESDVAKGFIKWLYMRLHVQEHETPEQLEACRATGRFDDRQCCIQHRLGFLEYQELVRYIHAIGVIPDDDARTFSAEWWLSVGIDLLPLDNNFVVTT